MTRLTLDKDPGEEFAVRGWNPAADLEDDSIVFYDEITKVHVLPEGESLTINIVLSICYRNALTEVFGWMWLARGELLSLESKIDQVRRERFFSPGRPGGERSDRWSKRADLFDLSDSDSVAYRAR
jgi:hypothetical protein